MTARGAVAQLDGGDGHRAEAPVVAAHDRRAPHRRVALERGAHVLGAHLEPAADDRLVGAAEDPEEAVGVDAGEVRRAHPAAAAPSCAGLHLEQALGVDAERGRRVSASTTRSSQPGCARPTLPRFVRPEASVVGEVPARDAAAELRRGVGGEHGHAVLRRERVGVVGVERRRPRDDRAEALEVCGIEVGVEHHAQRGRHEAGGGGPVAAHRVDPAVDREPLEQRERPAVADALQHPEEPAEVHERRVDDGDALAQPHGLRRGSTRSAWRRRGRARSVS